MYMSVQDSLSGSIKIGLSVVVLIVLACVALSFYGGRQTPQTHLVVKVIPDAQLPH